MKKLINYMAVLGVASLFCACESDLDTATYNENTAKSAVLAAINESYVLDKNNSGATAITFTWEAPQMGYNAAATNNLEMDVKGKNFGSNKVVLSALSGTATSVAITHKDLNNRVLEILKAYKMEEGQVELEFRIRSSISEAASPLLSNKVVAKITPYNNEGKVAAKLAKLEAAYVLDKGQPDATVLTLNWEPAYVGDDLTPTYRIEMNLEDNNILKRVIVATIKGESTYSFTTSELNALVIGLLGNYEQECGATKVLFRILSSNSDTDPQLASEVVETLITPYGESVQIENVDGSIVTLADNSFTLTWTAGTDEEMRYTVEMDLEGKNFARKMVIATAVDGESYNVDCVELNKQIGYLLFAYGENTVGRVTAADQQKVEFRVCAYTKSNPVAIPSKAVSIVVNRNKQENEDYFNLLGDYCSWETNNSLRLYKTDTNTYKGLIFCNFLGEWKVYKGDWGGQYWGNNDFKENLSNIVLTSNSNNLPSLSSPCWSFTFYSDTKQLSWSKPANTWSLVANSGSESNAQSMYPMNDDKNYWLETTVDMSKGTTWLIRSDLNSSENITPAKVKGNYVKKDDTQFIVSETGNYTIRWYFNDAEPFIIVTRN